MHVNLDRLFFASLLFVIPNTAVFAQDESDFESIVATETPSIEDENGGAESEIFAPEQPQEQSVEQSEESTSNQSELSTEIVDEQVAAEQDGALGEDSLEQDIAASEERAEAELENEDDAIEADDGFEVVNGQIQVRQEKKNVVRSLMDNTVNFGIHLGAFYTAFVQSEIPNFNNESDVDPFDKWVGGTAEIGVVTNIHFTKNIGLVTGLNFGTCLFYRSSGSKIVVSKDIDKGKYLIGPLDASTVPESVFQDGAFMNEYLGKANEYNVLIQDSYAVFYAPVGKQNILYYVVSLPIVARLNPVDYLWFDLGAKMNYLIKGEAKYEVDSELKAIDAKDPFKAESALLTEVLGGFGFTFRLNGLYFDCGLHFVYGLNSIDTDYKETSKLFSVGLNLNFWIF